jgi:hypothetical protein
MDRLLALHRAALRSGDRPLAAALARNRRADRERPERADRALQDLPRLPPRRAPAGERVLRAVLRGLCSYLR